MNLCIFFIFRSLSLSFNEYFFLFSVLFFERLKICSAVHCCLLIDDFFVISSHETEFFSLFTLHSIVILDIRCFLLLFLSPTYVTPQLFYYMCNIVRLYKRNRIKNSNRKMNSDFIFCSFLFGRNANKNYYVLAGLQMPNMTGKKNSFLYQPIVLHFILENYDWNIIKSGFMKMLLRERKNKKNYLDLYALNCVKLMINFVLL